jgi:hypothetical protein
LFVFEVAGETDHLLVAGAVRHLIRGNHPSGGVGLAGLLWML